MNTEQREAMDNIEVEEALKRGLLSAQLDTQRSITAHNKGGALVLGAKAKFWSRLSYSVAVIALAVAALLIAEAVRL